ncbi:hypothetical protein FDECE_9084 [Fusarium decemcellulare]|nr:hypothetical protein FDECE_9084 [Fusarium decemcellulare]
MATDADKVPAVFNSGELIATKQEARILKGRLEQLEGKFIKLFRIFRSIDEDIGESLWLLPFSWARENPARDGWDDSDGTEAFEERSVYDGEDETVASTERPEKGYIHFS